MTKAPTKSPKDNEAFTPLTSAKLRRLIIKNFRCIGPDPVSIDLDDIVVLVGPNNAGKSTILRAYEVVMAHGTTEGRLKREDFPAEEVDPENLPEIELQTYVWDKKPGEVWLHAEEATGHHFIRERWRWDAPDKEPKRQGRNATTEDWDEKVPWGAPGVANARRPIPHRVDAFSSPDEQANEIIKIMQQILLERARRSVGAEGSAIDKMIGQIRDLQKQVAEQSKEELEIIEGQLTSYLGSIFDGFKVSLDTRMQEVSEKNIGLFSEKPLIRMGHSAGHLATLDRQGSGARRTLLWSALKIASERKPVAARKAKKAGKPEEEDVLTEPSRPHVLLLDEPEICLHPAAIRDACRVLYDLAAQESGWQVMVTTHSPSFIDVSRDNTTVVRVERDVIGSVIGTTIFRPDKVRLSEQDKELLKLLNRWDPYVGEFFFGRRNIIVEGDTEFSVFREIIDNNLEDYRGVHVIRARGKYIIPTIAKILNHFGSPYAILHDTDTPLLNGEKSHGKANPAWAANQKILDVVNEAPERARVRLAASIIDFENALFNDKTSSDKPYIAVMKIREDEALKGRVKDLLDFLIFRRDDPPAGIRVWHDINEIRRDVINELGGASPSAAVA